MQVGVLGASSLVGDILLADLGDAGFKITAFSRQAKESSDEAVRWEMLSAESAPTGPGEQISLWASLLPIWLLPEYFPLLNAAGVRRLVVLSSTSRFSKLTSPHPQERALAHRLAEAESAVRWLFCSQL